MNETSAISKYRLEIWFGTLALLVGGIIYVIFRSNHLLMFSWFDCLGVSNNVELLRDVYGNISIYPWVKYNLPAALWLFSYLFIMHGIWKNDITPILYWTYILIMPFVAIFSEILQYFNLTPGTFDILDLISYIIALLSFLLYKKYAA